MKLKYITIAMLAAAAGLVILALALDLGRTGSTAQDAAAEGAPTAAQGAEGTVPDAAPTSAPGRPPTTTGDEAAPSSKPSNAPSALATRPSWDPQPTATDQGLEVPEPTSTAPARMPDSAKRTPVLSQTPKSQVAQGKLTKDFPRDAVPLPKSASVVSSSVDLQGERVLVGVEGRTDQGTEEVLSFYREHFDTLQWLITESTPVPGTVQLQAGIELDSTTVTVRQLPTGMTAISAAGVYTVRQ